MKKNIKILGIISVTIGIIAALLCILPYGLFLSLPVGFIGMICSCIYIYIDTKNNIGTKKFTAGIWGVILNSIPMLLVLTFIIISSFRHR